MKANDLNNLLDLRLGKGHLSNNIGEREKLADRKMKTLS
jgi:hypothetical protein